MTVLNLEPTMNDAALAPDPSTAAPVFIPDGVFAEKVTEVQHYTDRLFRFRITRPQSFRFRSGEFVMIGLPNAPKPVMRAYSVASPSWDEELEFFSIKVPGGPLTEHLQKIKVGDTVIMRPKPTGTLVNDALLPGKRLFCFSTGTGFAPFASLIRDPETYEKFEHVVVTHTCRQRDELKYSADTVQNTLEDPLVGEVAQGHLDVQIPAEPAGSLLADLALMVASLRQTVARVHQTTESVDHAASEIAAGNTDLSTRTEQTASSLQQTASAMEQLTGTVAHTAQAARTANQLAATAGAVAQRGGTVVSQVVQTMDEINRASERMSDIIGVIDGISFQTNILALNAAVEAARAGEQGRGFAVVASEVRSLAGRSAEAAKEIKQLITASMEKTGNGARLVGNAGETMQELVASVARVTDIVGEISNATQEQSQGLGSINQAVAGLEEMTQRNAALVEQSAAAALSLREQSKLLSGAVSRFRCTGEVVAG